MCAAPKGTGWFGAVVVNHSGRVDLRRRACQRSLGRNGRTCDQAAAGAVVVGEETFDLQELGVQDRGTGGATDRVVAEQGVLDAEDRALAHATDHRGHSLLAIAVEYRLRAVAL